MTDPIEKALDALDWDYGGDMADYLGEEWREVLRPHIKAAVDASTDRLRERLRECQGSEFHGMHQQMVGLHRGLEVQGTEVERLRDLLGRLEWAGRDGLWPCCPVCGGHQRDDHVGIGPDRADCWLAAELQRRDPPDSPPPPEGEAQP